MKHSNEELIKLWANHEKRQAFIGTYKDWGVYVETPETNLTYYKYDLPDGAKLIVMEHMQENYHPRNGEEKWFMRSKAYLQKGEYFMPNAASDYEICNHLKELKKILLEGKK